MKVAEGQIIRPKKESSISDSALHEEQGRQCGREGCLRTEDASAWISRCIVVRIRASMLRHSASLLRRCSRST